MAVLHYNVQAVERGQVVRLQDFNHFDNVLVLKLAEYRYFSKDSLAVNTVIENWVDLFYCDSCASFVAFGSANSSVAALAE